MFQPTLSDLGQPLADVTFVVVDLETTGGSPERDRITEIGAVKVRRGERLGELSTLVDPGQSVPRSITALTGISDATVAGRPPVSTVLPSFLEFSRGCALVAHNARFDVGFLNAALERLDYPRLDHPVVCTAQLARRVVGDELRSHRLASLAHHFRSSTVPVHRALADARATVDVLHGLLERAGTFGVVTLEDLIAFSRVRNMPVFTARRKMADDLPQAPGVYRFVSAAGEVLYVGKASNLRDRVRQYFGTDRRRRVAELVKEAKRVDHTVTATAVEAEILEAREIREHRPRFNRRGKAVRKPVWVKLTREAYPRLSIVRTVKDDGCAYLGPLTSRRVAEELVEAIHDAVPIRRCTTRMAADTRFAPCVLAELGKCLGPCDGRVDSDSYADAAAQVEKALQGDAEVLVRRLQERMGARADQGRFEEAAECRDRLQTLVSTVVRARQDEALRSAGLLVASRRSAGRREVAVVSDGWLLGTLVMGNEHPNGRDGHGTAARRPLDRAQEDPPDILEDPAVRALLGAAHPSSPPPTEELQILQRWLYQPEVVMAHSDRPLAWPVSSGAVLTAAHERLGAVHRRAGRPEGHLAHKRLARTQATRGAT